MFFRKLKSPGPVKFLIVGLGNPGSKYEGTRHNVGFLVLDKIAQDMGVPVNKLKFKGLMGTGAFGETQVLLLKPTTFMNLSGQAVQEAMQFYKLTPEQVLVIYDDISLEPGRLRIRRTGSDGGHNGMKNIIQRCGSDQFPRIKIGVGKKPHPEYDLADWVLSRFSPSEQKNVEEAAEKALAAAHLVCQEQLEKAMNLYNS